MEENSKWQRDAKQGSATRPGDGLALTLEGIQWMATSSDGTARVVSAPPISSGLEAAICSADRALPPSEWTYRQGAWTREGWYVLPEQTGWYVYRDHKGDVERASVQEFPTADRARRWAEVRLDRLGTSLRGPKPRAGQRSNKKLPDVRVTEAEKTAVMELLDSLGINYSQFVRAALKFAGTHIVEGDWTVDSTGTPSFERAG